MRNGPRILCAVVLVLGSLVRVGGLLVRDLGSTRCEEEDEWVSRVVVG